ncbi:MAG: hypothetical protein LBS01_08250 [Prevotellaceae bacterium]|nr:hypothetical protein [Prevotellaceae bacterium]
MSEENRYCRAGERLNLTTWSYEWDYQAVKTVNSFFEVLLYRTKLYTQNDFQSLMLHAGQYHAVLN